MSALRDEILKLTRYIGSTPIETAIAEAALNERARPTFSPARALEATLRLSLEGYLGHPHYGGNRDASVWNALSIAMPRQREAHHGG